MRAYVTTSLPRNTLSRAKGIIDDALQEVTEDNRFHPVREYLKGLSWDGECRLDTLFIDYIGAENTEYIRAVTRKWMWCRSSCYGSRR